jgi:hypothetical protein
MFSFLLLLNEDSFLNRSPQSMNFFPTDIIVCSLNVELQESDYEDLTTFVDALAAENTEFQVHTGA